MERLVRKQISDYLSVHNLIETEQHGSRSGRGTLSQLLVQHDTLVEKLSQGKNMELVYLDFSKAFDLVDHSLLLNKLKAKGVHGQLLKWIHCFLKNRKQCVRVGNNLSK